MGAKAIISKPNPNFSEQKQCQNIFYSIKYQIWKEVHENVNLKHESIQILLVRNYL